jgi:hypothetical protein
VFEKGTQRFKIVYRRNLQDGRPCVEGQQAISGAELLGERMPLPQPIGCIAQGQLCAFDHAALGRATSGYCFDSP